MRLTRFLLPLLLVAATAGAATSIPPVQYKHRVLPNGLEVYSIQDRSTPTVAVHVWYRVGSKHDPEGRSGFAHLFEHMMFKSTKNMPSEMMDRLTEDIGGFNNATTFDDSTAYYEVVPSNYLQTLLWAEAERLGSLNVDETNFKSERDVVKEEFRFRVLAPPYGRLFYALERNSFAKHPYRRPGIGSIEELDAATIDDVRAFHRTFYRPDGAVLIVAGDFEQQQLDGWVDQYFAPIAKPESAIPAVAVEEPARTEEKRVDEYAPNVALPAVALTWLIPAASHADAIPLFMAATILSEGESSRLQEKLVRGEIAQEVFADADLRGDLGLFGVVAFMASEHQPAEAEKVIRAELAKLAEKPVPDSELEKARNLIVTSALRQRETSNGKAFTLGEALILHHDPSIVNTGLAKVQSTTAADIQRVVKKYLIDGKAVVITYRDEGEKESAVGSRQSAVDEALLVSGDGRGLRPTADRRPPTVLVGGAK
ncbi:MAG: insulinase family protein [Acidobacteriota bacterium]|nr:insulinase family protein [Acidobacteriota bacterium]